MKNNIYNLVYLLLVVLTLVSTQSCTDDFEEINTDPFTITDEQGLAEFKILGLQMETALQNIYAYSPAWVTQLQQNLIGDVYSGYMMPPTPFAGNINNMTYQLVDGWNEWPWRQAYEQVMAPLNKMETIAGDDFPAYKAWSKIIRVEAMHRVSDHYGPIVYRNFGGENNGVYESQEDAYKHFFEDLAEAITVFESLVNDPNQGKVFENFDLVYGGEYTSWIKFANSLRLRLAIRISKVDPALAKTEGEKSLNHTAGLIESNDLNFVVNSKTGATHPLNTMNNAWNDIRMGAPMESILSGYNDPRIESYFQPAVQFPGEFVGIRQGIPIAAKGDYENFSKLTDFGAIQLMAAAEILFLKAEAALRGWSAGGTEQGFYEAGVQMSFDQHGQGSATNYLNDNSSTAVNYVDPVNGENNIDATSDITIKWDESDSFERKLERIITQKWIAMYPDGQEAWSEFRRTGYPKLFPVRINNSNGTISTDDFVKRINFAAIEFSTNAANVEAAKALLGGPDNGGTSLWWDVD